jgi:hypothetical protein
MAPPAIRDKARPMVNYQPLRCLLSNPIVCQVMCGVHLGLIFVSPAYYIDLTIVYLAGDNRPMRLRMGLF